MMSDHDKNQPPPLAQARTTQAKPAQAVAVHEPSTALGFGNLASFEFTQRAARALSSSTLVPVAFREATPVKAWEPDGEWKQNPNAISNCIIVLNMADRMKADPLMVMQNLHIIEGRPSWSSQFVIAAVNSCGRFSPIRFVMSEAGEERSVSFDTTKWENRQKVTVKVTVKVRDRTCRAWVVEKGTSERLDGPEVSIQMAIDEGWLTKNGSKWVTMPEVMLRYRAAALFGRLYAPELLMGLPTQEEMVDVIDITPDPVPLANPVAEAKWFPETKVTNAEVVNTETGEVTAKPEPVKAEPKKAKAKEPKPAEQPEAEKQTLAPETGGPEEPPPATEADFESAPQQEQSAEVEQMIRLLHPGGQKYRAAGVENAADVLVEWLGKMGTVEAVDKLIADNEAVILHLPAKLRTNVEDAAQAQSKGLAGAKAEPEKAQGDAAKDGKWDW